MIATWRRGIPRLAPLLALAFVVILSTAPGASGQAALDQYVPSGKPAGGSGKPDGGGGGEADTLGFSGTGGPASAADDPGSGSTGGGTFPVTDSPAIPFLWILIAILLAGALVRLTMYLKERRALRST